MFIRSRSACQILCKCFIWSYFNSIVVNHTFIKMTKIWWQVKASTTYHYFARREVRISELLRLSLAVLKSSLHWLILGFLYALKAFFWGFLKTFTFVISKNIFSDSWFSILNLVNLKIRTFCFSYFLVKF